MTELVEQFTDKATLVSALVHHRDWGIDRVELMVRGEGAPEPGTATLKEFLAAESGISLEELDRHAYFDACIHTQREEWQ